MPLAAAKQQLGVTSRITSHNAVVSPGFPPSSMFYDAIDGTFEGDYNRMLIVTDKADQGSLYRVAGGAPVASGT